MGALSRIGVALDSDLLARFDAYIAQKSYSNRSEAFRDLIRDRLVNEAAATGETEVVGTITLVYDHHYRLLPNKLLDLQHQCHDLVIATTHVHLNHSTCLEVIVVKGRSDRVHGLADLLIGTKGVQHGKLVVSAPDTYLADSHAMNGVALSAKP